jgi:hypothetical protein
MAWVNVEDLLEPIPAKEADEVERISKLKKTRAHFLADENFPADAVALMRTAGLKVQTAPEAGLVHHPDENYVSYALREGMVLVTCDRDFVNRRKFPLIHCCAIVVFDFGRGTRADMVRAMRCLVTVDRAPMFYDKWAKLDATPDGWTEETRYMDGTTSRTRYRRHEGHLQEWR